MQRLKAPLATAPLAPARPAHKTSTSKTSGSLFTGLVPTNVLARFSLASLLAVSTAAVTVGAESAAAAASMSVTKVDVAAEGDRASTITIAATEPPQFNLFRLQNPTRLVVDIQGADIAQADVPKAFESSSLVSGVTTTQFRGKNGPVARVVVVMRGEIEFSAQEQGKSVVISASRIGAPEPAKAAAVEPARTPAPAVSGTPVIEINGDAPAPTSAAKHLTKIRASESQGGAMVRLLTDGEVSRYEIEEVDNPPRLVIDLVGLSGPKAFNRGINVPGLKRVRAAKHPGKTRVVLEALDDRLPTYDVASTSEGLTLIFEPPQKHAVETKTARLKDVTLEDKDGFWRLGMKVGESVAVRTVANAPREKTIAIDGLTVAPGLLARAPKAGGPVGAIRMVPSENGGALRVTLDLDTDVEHSVWQKDGYVYWDVREKVDAPAPMARVNARPQPRAAGYQHTTAQAAMEGTAAKRYRGKKITIDLMNANIVNVLRLLGDVSRKNVVVGEDVEGTVSIKLKNVPWDQALDVILRTKGLGKEVRGGIIRVAPQARLDAEREARLKLQKELVDKAPTTVRLIPVNYAVASELVPQIEKLLSEKRGRATFDERTNVIIVEDVRENLDQAEQLVRTLDTQTPQVLVEARMVEASTEFSRNIGIQWGGGLTMSQRGGNPTGLVFPANVGLVGGADNVQDLVQRIPTPGVPFPSNFAVNMPVQTPTTGVGLNLGSIGNFGFLNARLTAAETNGEVKIISAPKVTTLNNKRASIKQGVEYAFPVILQNQVQFQVIEANLELDVVPHVTADGSILMQVRMSNNAPDFQNRVGDQPTFTTKEAQTEMLVKDGDTAVIGGIYTRATATRYDQTPFLGSIPLLGWLFKSSISTDERTELLVFISPRIINRRSSGF